MTSPTELRVALEDALRRGPLHVDEVVRNPNYLTPAEIGKTMGLGVAEIMNGVELDFILAIDLGELGLRLPSWQLDAGGKPLRGLEELIEDVAEIEEGTRWRLIRVLEAEGGHLLNRLRAGHVGEVRRIAIACLQA
jgi:hypothetical protein